MCVSLWGRSPGGGHGNPFQYSYLENYLENSYPSRDRGVWWATVHRGHRVRHNRSNLTRISLSLYKVKKICLKGEKQTANTA